MKEQEPQDPGDEGAKQESSPASVETAEKNRETPTGAAVQGDTSRSIRQWMRKNGTDVFWAAVFAFPFAFIVGWFLDPPKPDPYIIYVVVDRRTDPETMAAFKDIERSSQADGLSVGDVPVRVKAEILDSADSAIQKADDLTKRTNTLLVVAHLPSQLIEDSLPTYFRSAPPVPVLTTTASDEDLLVKMNQTGGFTPLLQLSPTNKEQGRAAVRFATQKHLRHFLIVSDSDSSNATYTKDLSQAYHDAVEEFNQKTTGDRAEIVGSYTLAEIRQSGSKLEPDCVLYAGDLEKAHSLMQRYRGPRPVVILSDSTLASRLSDNALKDFGAVRFTFQTDATDYNHHTNIYGKDAYNIAKQLIGDLNRSGGDFRYRLKTTLHIHSVKDARRNLVQTMQENSMSRTWYQGTSETSGEPGSVYVFNQHRRVDGIFHVWQMRSPVAKPGSQMDDIDNWHPPKEILQTSKSSGRVANSE